MADTCQADIGLYLGGTVPVDVSLKGSWGCDQPATVTLRAGCVHEHVKAKRYCAEHGRVNPSNGVWLCRECAELGHDCPIRPEVVASGG
jgi:hypothetical protein